MDSSVIDQLAQAKVLVIGDLLIDCFVQGAVGRVSPEAPVPVLARSAENRSLGGAGNVAANILAFGAEVTLVAVVGNDGEADAARALCAGHDRLEATLIADPERPTTVKTRYLADWHQLLRVDSEATGPLSDAVADRLVEAVENALPSVAAVVLSDYAKGVLSAGTIPRLIAAARRHGIPVIVDPKNPDPRAYAGATLIKPNSRELQAFTGRPVADDDAAADACRSVLEAADVSAVLVTRGSAGMTLVERDKAPLHVRAEGRRVFDVTGAGDTVAATLAAAVATGVPLRDAIRIANAAAGVVVDKPGTATVHPRELRRALGVEASAHIATRAEALDQIRNWKTDGLVIGFTNGCFDLLHRGHLYSLEQASRRVDRLVVGVNDDASVTRLKGEGRPVQDLETRSAVLTALRFVDLVVPFPEDTPAALIDEVVPDVLFKGTDYAEDEVVGGDLVRRNGGRVELIPILPGHSTSGTVERLGNRGS